MRGLLYRRYKALKEFFNNIKINSIPEHEYQETLFFDHRSDPE
jgi:hypothetical protein